MMVVPGGVVRRVLIVLRVMALRVMLRMVVSRGVLVGVLVDEVGEHRGSNNEACHGVLWIACFGIPWFIWRYVVSGVGVCAVVCAGVPWMVVGFSKHNVARSVFCRFGCAVVRVL
jgi:hypothetical protein